MTNDINLFNRTHLEHLRIQAKMKFDKIRPTQIDCLSWVLPHRAKWLQSISDGERNNHKIVDATHVLGLRSYVAGFMEGNTSSTRPWFRTGTNDPELNKSEANREWLQLYTDRCHYYLNQGRSNFYHAAGGFYYDFGGCGTGGHYIDERKDGFFFHNLTPGSYYVINNGLGEAVVLVREFALTVKALVETYGRKKNGQWDWSNFSSSVRKMYEDSNYTQQVMIVHIVKENDLYDPNKPEALLNRRWISITYELGENAGGQYYQAGDLGGDYSNSSVEEKSKYLKISASRRKPFVIGRGDSSNNFEYGEKFPTLDALGMIKSLNKKAISKDQALDQMLRPPLQGPANLKKSYLTTAPNNFIPLDPSSMKPGGGLRTVFEVNPAIQFLITDVEDLRRMVDKLYFVDYLLYLSQNPKTRTATETNAIVQEQQLIIGPNLQSLNWTYNVPILDFVMDWVLTEDPYLPDPPADLAGRWLRPEFISVFAQAQKAADLPSIERYITSMSEVAQLNPQVWDKVNLDKLGDLYEDRLFLPVGLNNSQERVNAVRQQREKMAQRQQMLNETLPAVASATKDLRTSKQLPQGGG